MGKFFALVAVAAARRHHHHHNVEFVDEEAQLETMSDTALVTNLQATLNSALNAEARDDKAAAVAKTAAIKNIQKAIEGMQPQINDMERRLGIMQSVEPVLENAIKTLQKVVDVRGMGKK